MIISQSDLWSSSLIGSSFIKVMKMLRFMIWWSFSVFASSIAFDSMKLNKLSRHVRSFLTSLLHRNFYLLCFFPELFVYIAHWSNTSYARDSVSGTIYSESSTSLLCKYLERIGRITSADILLFGFPDIANSSRKFFWCPLTSKNVFSIQSITRGLSFW